RSLKRFVIRPARREGCTMRISVALALVFCVGCGNGTAGNDSGVGNGGEDMGPLCGNGVVDPNEDCDDGPNNGKAGDRCGQLCSFACNEDVTCDDHNACNGAEKCSDHACTPGTPPGDGTSCGNGMLCRAGACVAARCGDSIVTAPEECDDGN